MIIEKYCRHCNQSKPLSEFHEKRLKGRHQCKQCQAGVRAKWRKENGAEHRRRWIAERSRQPERNILAVAKLSAKKRGLEFNITVDDIVIPTHCPYMGWELTYKLGNGRIPTNLSIDRIDSTKGYVKGNIQIISYLANLMKRNATEEEMINFAIGILKTHAPNKLSGI